MLRTSDDTGSRRREASRISLSYSLSRSQVETLTPFSATRGRPRRRTGTPPFCISGIIGLQSPPHESVSVLCRSDPRRRRGLQHCGRDLKLLYLGKQPPVVRVKKATIPLVKYGLIVVALLLLYWSFQATYF